MSNLILRYRKNPKISPRAYFFRRPFLRGLVLEGPIFGGAYVRREICVSKLIGLACSGKEIYHFCFVLLCTRGQIPSTSPPGGLYPEGRFNGGSFVLRFMGAYIWRGLFSEFYGILSGRYRYPPSFHALKDWWDKKATSRGFSGGKQVIKSANTRNRAEFFYSGRQKMKNFLYSRR